MNSAETQFAIDRDYLVECYKWALRSPDPSTQNGAIIVAVDGREARGCNSIPFPLETTEARLQRPEKSKWIEHAERRAIASAARRGVECLDATMYCPWAPCTPCARLIVDSGIKHLVIHETTLAITPERWLDDVTRGQAICEEGGVRIRRIACHLPEAPSIRFNGALFQP